MEPCEPETPEMVADAHAVERDRSHLNEQEQALLKELLRPGASIEAVIPPDAAPEHLWKTLDACVRGLGLLEARSTRLKFIVGKLLIIFENKPSLYKGLGYETFSEFITKGAYATLGLHKTSAYEGKMAARWPQLTPDRYAKVGPKKMNILNHFMTGNNSNAEEWLKTAESMKVNELQQYVEQRGLLNNGETDAATIVIKTDKSIYSRYREVFEDGRVHHVVGSKDHGRILVAMMAECYQEWLNKYDEDRRQKMAAKDRARYGEQVEVKVCD